MRALTWLWRGFLFLALFAFAMKNQHVVEVYGFFGYSWQAPMVFVILGIFAIGCAVGVLAMVPSWWRHRTDARKRLHMVAQQAPRKPEASPRAPLPENLTLPSELTHPPDMPAPRKPAR